MQSAPILDLDQFELTQIVQGALRRAFGDSRHAVKRLAEAGGMSPATAKNLLEGKNAPSTLRTLQLAVLVPELGGELRRLLAIDALGDPELMRDLARVVQQYQRIEEVQRANDMARVGMAVGAATEPALRAVGSADQMGRAADRARGHLGAPPRPLPEAVR